MNKDKKKKNPSIKGILLIGLVMIVSSLAEFLENARLAGVAGVAVFVIVFAVILILAVKEAKKKKGSSRPGVSSIRKDLSFSEKLHSHDRLDSNRIVRCADGYQHWINQLDGFLDAGLIDRSEYRALIEKHPKESFDR